MADENTKAVEPPNKEKIQRRIIGMATASLVLGIIGILWSPLVWVLRAYTPVRHIIQSSFYIGYWFTPLFFFLAIVFAIISMHQAKKLGIKSPVSAKVGLALSIIFVLIILVCIIFVVAWFSNPNNT